MRHKYNKRKEAYVKSKKPPKRRLKEEKDKDVFKRRKFIKDVFVEKDNEQVEDSSSSEEENETGYGQMLQMFGGNAMEKHAIESDSEDENENQQSDTNMNNSDGDESDNEELEERDENDIKAQGEGMSDDSDGEDKGNDSNESEEEEESNAEEEDHDNMTVEITSEDPFSAHFEIDIDQDIIDAVDNKSKRRTSSLSFPNLGNLHVQTIEIEGKNTKLKTLIDEEDKDSKLKCRHRQLISAIPDQENKNLFLKQRLQEHNNKFSGFETDLLNILGSYKDFMFTQRSKENADEIKKIYTLHALNHILKTQSKILNNNSKHEAREDGNEKLRDQGFSRPKVLIVVPFKESCRSIVEILIQLFAPEKVKGNIANRKRFNEDYVKVETVRKDKPDDFYDIFSGDVDDSFKLGIAVTKKTLKLYTDFYSSDIIICSPLGLRLVTGVEGEGGKTDTDFLSSIELLIVDQADVLLMQNWDHVSSIINQLHQQPKESHGVDFGRIRLWCLDGNSKYYRQTVLISGVPSPEINGVWNRNCVNYMGKVKAVSDYVGDMSRIVCDTSLVWHRVTSDSLAKSVEARFKYFTEKVMPRFKKDSMYHTCVFVPSYFDYVKVRNWFKASDLDYCEVNEYTKEKKIAQARDMFYHNEKHFLLYTERSHFYRRFRLKGIRHLIFYQPPTFGWMFSELCNLLQKSFQNPRGGTETNMSITVIYSKYDIQR